MKSRPRFSYIPLVHVPFQEDVDIVDTSTVDVDVQDIGTIVHESGELGSFAGGGMVRGSKERAQPAEASTPAVSTGDECLLLRLRQLLLWLLFLPRRLFLKQQLLHLQGLLLLCFNKQSRCAKVITEIMKAHFVEAHSSSWKASDRMKNMWYTEFGHEKMGKAFAQLELYVLLYQQKGQGVDTQSDKFWAKYQELKGIAERLHVETSSHILIDE
ncbi:hypothetical protein M9H77_17745 [Catharanthus roseus]|uniref:Uncharacterized protein n=1 Tax=Catharanthus roseus TaxID=4058 RepID=A0ACC0B5G3_CATRO|nr:hypothetical protein M9H77_17745 [Catharanthus roseus]